VFGHQLRQNLILALNLLLQVFDALLLGRVIGPALGLKRRRPVLEELFLQR
jgi:hypothetical protein